MAGLTKQRRELAYRLYGPLGQVYNSQNDSVQTRLPQSKLTDIGSCLYSKLTLVLNKYNEKCYNFVKDQYFDIISYWVIESYCTEQLNFDASN